MVMVGVVITAVMVGMRVGLVLVVLGVRRSRFAMVAVVVMVMLIIVVLMVASVAAWW